MLRNRNRTNLRTCLPNNRLEMCDKDSKRTVATTTVVVAIVIPLNQSICDSRHLLSPNPLFLRTCMAESCLVFASSTMVDGVCTNRSSMCPSMMSMQGMHLHSLLFTK
mmetsp:Transcript_3428/g.9083  ORF Transcript_3428/g.9083 Transcript_3428/m.9083 type:complete len:108 (-) Transcript_3428:1727-2050(-)